MNRTCPNCKYTNPAYHNLTWGENGRPKMRYNSNFCLSCGKVLPPQDYVGVPLYMGVYLYPKGVNNVP